MPAHGAEPGVHHQRADLSGVLHVRDALQLLVVEHADGAAFRGDSRGVTGAFGLRGSGRGVRVGTQLGSRSGMFCVTKMLANSS